MTEDGDRSLSADSSCTTPSESGSTFVHQRHGSRVKNVVAEETPKVPNKKEEFVSRLRWPDLTAQVFIHLGCLYGFYLILVSAKIYTTLFGE